MSHSKPHAVIAGGGLAGSLLALVLAARGYRVSVFEKRDDLRGSAAPRGRSINLALSERGIHALKHVGVAEEALRQTIPMRGRLIHGQDRSIRYLPYSGNANEFIRSISRPGLNRLLLEAASRYEDIDLHFNCSIESILPQENTVVLRDARNVTMNVTYDILFGADGAGSAVRKGLGLETDHGFSMDLLEHGYKELEMPALPDGAFAMPHEALHIWPRGTYMLIALPNLDHSFTCTLFLPNDGNPGFNQLTTTESVRNFFSEQFPDALDLLPGLEEDFFTNPTGILGTIRCASWSGSANSVILGDAAHAIVPFFGQGMNCAFEDVSVLADMMDDPQWTSGWPELIAQFERDRIPNANAIADMALENYIEMRDLVADPGFQLRRQVALELERQFPDRFKPRYSLVSFERLPYSKVQEVGVLQSKILNDLCSGKTKMAEVDFGKAADLVQSLPDF